MRGAAVALWLAFAAVILTGAGIALRACGILPWGINACPAADPGGLTAAARQRDGLLRLRDSLLESANLAPQCRIAEPEPPVREGIAECQPPPAPEVVILLDVSGSMHWDLNADPVALARIDEIARTNGDADEYDRLIRRLDAGPGRDRIDLAKDVLLDLGAHLPPRTEINLLTFAQCGVPPRSEGVFDGGGPEFDAAVRAIGLRQNTALADAIAALPMLVRGGRTERANILILSDGEDNCDGDPCAAAQAMKQELPLAEVSVISVAKDAQANRCVAHATGGRFFQVNDIADLAQRVRQAAGTLSDEKCAELAPGAANEGEVRP